MTDTSTNGHQPVADDAERSVEDRLDALEDRIETVAETQQTVRETAIKPRLERLQDQRDDARTERAELQAQVEDLQATVAELQAQLEVVIGIEDSAKSSKAKRHTDLRAYLIERAKDRDDNVAKMDYRRIQEFYRNVGHGDLADSTCVNDLKAVAASHDALDEDTMVSHEGNTVQAVAVDLDKVGPESVSELKNSNPRRPTQRGDIEE